MVIKKPDIEIDALVVLFCDISSVTREDLEKIKECCEKERLSYASRFRFEKDAVLTLTGEYLLKTLVSSISGTNIMDLHVLNPGKAPKINAPYCVSVSHSGHTVAAAASKRRIGIDVEELRSAPFNILKKFASDAELEYAQKSDERFFKLWTLKESYFKCKGTGISYGLKNVSFTFEKDAPECSDDEYDCFTKTIEKKFVFSACIEK